MNRFLKISGLFFFFLLVGIQTRASEKGRSFRLLFYNVENLFYPSDDTLSLDDDFTPKGNRFWTFHRYKNKINRLGKVILSSGRGDAPDLAGLCEVENRRVLEELTQKTPLKVFNYRILHKESPDKRGIDVALLYREDRFSPLKYKLHPVEGEGWCSREILEVCGIMNGNDTLSVFVNHWPSRYSGVLETRDKRIAAAEVLAAAVDSIFFVAPWRKIVICGDFNDEPEDKSLGALLDNRPLKNLSSEWKKGTIKHQGQWTIFDQFIVSINLKGEAEIFSAPFLLEPDEKYMGNRPKRTYIGYRYHGGFSDHLPVVAEFYF